MNLITSLTGCPSTCINANNTCIYAIGKVLYRPDLKSSGYFYGHCRPGTKIAGLFCTISFSKG